MEESIFAAIIRFRHHDPTVFWASVLTTLCVLVLLIPASHYRHDAEPVEYVVDLPHELRPGCQWDLSEEATGRSEPEVRDGKIYPRCPADGRRLTDGPIIPATPQKIDDAISRASIAQQNWAKTTFAQRRLVLKILLHHINTHQEEIVTACCLDTGKTKIDACFGEILVSTEKLQWTIKHGEKALAPSSRPINLLLCYKKNTVVYEPLGVVAACFSWNYPFHFFISNVVSALFAGNAVVLKPSEQTCWSSRYFQDVVRGALTACGHDPNLVQTVICLPETASYLTSHPGLSYITFIGSKPVAYKICESAAKVLTPVCVELGGKDPAIVLDDKDTLNHVDDITSIVMRGVFQGAGQNCIGMERIIALPKIHDQLLQRLKPLVSKIRLGSVLLEPSNPPDMGSMVSPASFTRLEHLISTAVDAGATLHCGGTRHHHPKYPHGHFFTPTLLSNITPTMEISQTELFAPIMLLMKASDAQDAIHMANSTDYALGASVFGDPTSSTTRHVIASLRAGMVSVNDFGSYYATGMPFGGARGSGYGRFGGAEGLHALCNVKSVCEDAWWAVALGVRTRIPSSLRYPVRGVSGWRACVGIVQTGYGVGFAARVGGLRRLVGALLDAGGEAEGVGVDVDVDVRSGNGLIVGTGGKVKTR